MSRIISRKKHKFILSIILMLMLSLFIGECFATPSYTSSTATRNSIAYNWTFYAQGLLENNCLAYSIGNETDWIWPWGGSNPDLNQTLYWLQSVMGFTGQTYGSTPYQTCSVTAYGWSNNVTHFARVLSSNSTWATGTCRAKWGRYEIFSHSNLNPYTNAYGPLIVRFY
ncbi:MAG: hypothetical protein CVU90_08200 [Firmicutes bacterium HGW-Firmicutes-15]|nr:MAG: hypothetical protein CVU90_08200 [Firmicutes bacterium HGW-Firmicutes-15]